MNVVYALLLAMAIGNLSNAQTTTSKGDSLRKDGKLEAAIKAYTKDYQAAKEWKVGYNLACAYALTFQKDSAFHYLDIVLEHDTSLWPLADADLYALIDDPRWSSIENDQIQRYQENHGVLKQPEYSKQLLQIILKDQALDYYIDQAKSHFMKEGSAPQWYYPIGAYKQEIVKENYEGMLQLLDAYGWPKYTTVGELAADAPLLVINHHEDDAVRKKYLEKIKQSCLDGEGSCMEYAKIHDRILVNENQPQLYGMQFRYTETRTLEPFPIVAPEYVDQRREAIGLESLSVYLKRKINYDWTIVQKKR
ncbi:DUF6624 domain-containing protein [uncultured Dokdonia sp.]|uniref:DUF6624 domain-containing protein n=1 Tax=uncultured Dokdonia sp. TaxID=575653 RepID=UPI002622FB24|nr:DUF6624 domain-containing protein [uncultured Dokdonia sp.]